METTDFDWYDFEFEESNKEAKVPIINSIIRIGIFTKSFYTNKRDIAIVYEPTLDCFQFVLMKGNFDGDYDYTYNPVIVKMSNEFGIADEMIPFRNVHFCKDEHELTGNGYEVISTSSPSLFNNGVHVQINEFDNEILQLWINRLSINDYLKEIDKASSYCYNLEKEYQKVLSYVEKIDIIDILSNLKINVEEYFRYKVGGDDSYHVTKTVSLGGKEEGLDEYLKNYIGVGSRIIYSDHGYECATNMRLKGLITGDYSDKMIEEERQKLISNYSKETHTRSLIFATIKKLVPYSIHLKESLQYERCFERTTKYRFIWGILRSIEISKRLDYLDKYNTRGSIDFIRLKEINTILQQLYEQAKPFFTNELFSGTPRYPIL